ncbi:hypothetical protein JQC91_04780 [Jannaschia sp. Os4]|uniref:hypothetical protein n=1 Tax=Jannaschia sp. Os4 TaxID=2807617 RepID=UPI00193A9EA1|nr:hypothetical protein [Jannaschia sp. Os4]MBM2575613.1 hypothetical protein [Jannaschia sp. Os4]
MRTLLLLLALLASPALATQDGWPALHDVTGVAAGDVLNVRAGPGASHPVIAEFAPDATGIEVIGPAAADDRWGIVNVGEQAGYVSLRYLRRHPDSYLGAVVPLTRCFGAEPFWDVTLLRGRMILRDLGTDREVGVPLEGPFLTLSDRRVQVWSGAEGDSRLTLFTRAVYGPPHCSDGMADTVYGIEGTLLVEDGGAPRALAGCCSIAR